MQPLQVTPGDSSFHDHQLNPLQREFALALIVLEDNPISYEKLKRARQLFHADSAACRMIDPNQFNSDDITFEQLKDEVRELHGMVLKMIHVAKLENIKPLETNLPILMYSAIYDHDQLSKHFASEVTNDASCYSILYKIVKACTVRAIGSLEAAFSKDMIAVDQSCFDTLKVAILKLNNVIYSVSFANHRFSKFVCRLKGDRGVCPEGAVAWENCLVAAGVPQNLVAKYILASFRFNLIYNIDDLSKEDAFERKLHHILDNASANDQYQLSFYAATSNLHGGFEYAVRKEWLLKGPTGSPIDCLRGIMLAGGDLRTLQIILSSMKSADTWNKFGYRPLHTAISRPDAFDVCKLFVKHGANIKHGSKDKMDLVQYCRDKHKEDLALIFERERARLTFLKDLKEIFVEQLIGGGDSLKSYHIYDCTYVNEIIEPICFGEVSSLTAFSGKRESIMKLSLKLKEQGIWHKRRSICSIDRAIWKNHQLTGDTTKLGQEAYKSSTKKVCILLTDEDLRKFAERVNVKKFKPKGVKKVRMPYISKSNEIEMAPLPAVPGGGSSRQPKPETVLDRPVIEFSDADRQLVLLRLHEERVKRANALYQSKPTIEVVEFLPGRLTLEQIQDRAAAILGKEYSDEIACIVYAQQYFDPKTASSFEKSKCNSHYQAFRTRNHIDDVDHATVLSTSPLIELINPLKSKVLCMVKKADRKISINLQSAKHEFLFLKGLWLWRSELLNPEKLHLEIFEDCLRLGATRFYSSIFKYYWEVKNGELGDFAESITSNDFQAGRLRNLLVHNFFSVEELEVDVETLLFSLGDRVMRLCHHETVAVATISLDRSRFFKQEIRQLDAHHDARYCREAIFNRVSRMGAYIKLLESKQLIQKDCELFRALAIDWNQLVPELKIWVHPARAIESCILQIGELAKGVDRFISPKLQKYVLLCREIRHVGYHENNSNQEWNYDPLSPELLSCMIEGHRALKS